MHKLILAAAILGILAGCAALGPESDPSMASYDEQYWPPVVPGQAFPPQIMDGEAE